MDSKESRNENLTQQENETSKSKTLQKAKRKCNSEEAENSSPSGTLRKTLYNSLSRLSLRRRSKNVSVEMKDTEDGGPLVYPMDKRGQLFIMHNFAGNEKFPYRVGSSHDVGKLQACFKNLDFLHTEDDCKTNLKGHQMWECFRTWAEDWDCSNVDCVVIAILTHGSSGDLLLGVDGKHVALDDLLTLFDGNCCSQTLAGKPKIFIIEACRGEKEDLGVRDPTATAPGDTKEENLNAVGGTSPTLLQSADMVGSSRQPEVTNSGLLPNRADQLVAFATGVGYPAYRNTEKGSWYIDVLTSVLLEEYCSKKSKKHLPRHLLDLLPEVQGIISNFVKKGVDKNDAVQMPEFRCSLRGPIYFCMPRKHNRGVRARIRSACASKISTL